MKKKVDLEKTPLKEAYLLLNVTEPEELSVRYTQEDQKLMKSNAWDYKNPALITNKINVILEGINPTLLSADERYWRQNILWFWNHHAISCAIWRYKDKGEAAEYSEKALSYQPPGHPNKITRLLYLLIRDQLTEAEKWSRTIVSEPEKTTALHLLSEYQRGFFK
ncbi:MAG TPA: hypothetical protein VJH94_00535 [Candidatus Paceibacterota bacterium]